MDRDDGDWAAGPGSPVRNVPPVTVRLEPIGPDNWYACSRLEVRDDQRDAVAGNLLSIAELQFHPTWGGFAVRDGTPRMRPSWASFPTSTSPTRANGGSAP